MWPNAKYRIVKSLQIMPLKECALHSSSHAFVLCTALHCSHNDAHDSIPFSSLSSFSFIFQLFSLLRSLSIFLSVNIIIGAAFYVITEYNNKTFWLCSRNHLFPLRNNIYFAEEEFSVQMITGIRQKPGNNDIFLFAIPSALVALFRISSCFSQCLKSSVAFYLRLTWAVFFYFPSFIFFLSLFVCVFSLLSFYYFVFVYIAKLCAFTIWLSASSFMITHLIRIYLEVVLIAFK